MLALTLMDEACTTLVLALVLMLLVLLLIEEFCTTLVLALTLMDEA